METLLDDFQNLPEAIKNWLASSHATDAIAAINKKLGIKEARRSILPQLILRLVVNDLEPQDFINELSGELKINYPTAKALTEEIESKILKPIENPLQQELSIDMKLLYGGAPAPIAAPKAVVETPAPAPVAAAPQPQIPVKIPTIVQTPTRQEMPAPEIKPRVIYKERTLPVSEEPPVNIKPASAIWPANKIRVVHYSGSVTPLNIPESEEENDLDSFTVDLRTI